MFKLLPCLATLLPMSSAALAANYYIAPTGSDSNAGALSSPWKTVAFASSKLKAGDVLYARGGTYTGQGGISWRSGSGTAAAPVRFQAYPRENPVFDGQNMNRNFMNIVAKDWVIIDGITVQNYKGCCAAIWTGYTGSGTDYAENNTVRNSTFRNIGKSSQTHGVYVSYGNKNITINNNKFFGISGAAIHFYHKPGAVGGKIYNNLIYGGGESYWGMVLRYATSIQIYNNTVLDNIRDIDLGSSTGMTLRNNIMSKPLTAPTGLTASNNMFLSGTPNDGGGSSSFVAAARFVNPSALDFRLQSTSDAINRGATVSSVTSDLDQISRPQGSAYDIGAYER